MVSMVLAAVALMLAFMMDRTFLLILLAYFVLNLAYSLKIKQVVILDIMFIASGFVLRILAGTTLAGVNPSDWLVICTITLSLFLGFSKRRNELVLMGENAGTQRKVLKEYSIHFLDQMISMVTACTVMSYILYTVSPETVGRFGTKNLMFSIPFALFGVFRYLYLIYLKKKMGDPIDLILKDFPFLLNILLWISAVMIIIY
jgi:4-hydroxybenzoate polyprenyltransferase